MGEEAITICELIQVQKVSDTSKLLPPTHVLTHAEMADSRLLCGYRPYKSVLDLRA